MKLKTLLFALAVTTIISGCNLTNTIRMKNANDHLVADWPVEATEVLLETYYIGEKPYIAASINGVEGFKFMIDTGASMSYVFDTPKVEALGLAKGYTLSVGGWGDEEDSTIFQTSVEKISLAGVTFEQVNLAYLPVTKSKYFLRADEAIYDGVLGHDMLHHFSWKFDKAANQISISRLPYKTSGNEVSFEFDTFLSKISIEGELDFGKQQLFQQDLIIDTGSRHYLKVAAELIDNNDIELPGRSISALDFGLSGRAAHQRVTLPQLRLGEMRIAGVKTNLIGGDFDDDNGVIGSALLNQYISIIDYHSDKLHLISDPDSRFNTNYNLLGLELRKIRSNEFVVRYIFPQMVSANFDFEEGDIIKSINGESVSNISQGLWLKLSATAGIYRICRMRQALKCMTLESKHIPGYSMPEDPKSS